MVGTGTSQCPGAITWGASNIKTMAAGHLPEKGKPSLMCPVAAMAAIGICRLSASNLSKWLPSEGQCSRLCGDYSLSGQI